MEITVSWTTLKEKQLELQYIYIYANYYIFSISGDIKYCCILSDSSSDAADFENNYMDSATNLV